MKVFAIEIFFKESETIVKQLQSSHDLTTFSFFQKGSAKEFMDFTAKLVVERTQRCMRSTVKEQEYLCHVYVRPDNLAGVLLSDQEYPQRVAQTLLTKLLEEFSCEYPASEWGKAGDNTFHYKKVDEYLQKYQNPREADAMMKLQADLDETKIIMHGTLEALLQRGEKIDDLVQRSENLSLQSKAFYTTAKKTNRCCSIL